MHDPFSVIAEYYDEIMSKVDYAAWAQYIRTLFNLAPLKSIKKVLDLAVGTGNVAYYLINHNYEIVGLDYSIGMIRVAKRKFESKENPPKFVLGDFRKIPFKQKSFDAVISTFDSLNNILDPKELQDTFTQVRSILKDGGAFVFDLNTDWSLKTEWDDKTRVEETAKTITIWRSRYSNGISYLYFTLFVKTQEDYYKKISTIFRERGYGPSEVRRLLKKAGFKECLSFEHFTLNPGKEKSSRNTYLAY